MIDLNLNLFFLILAINRITFMLVHETSFLAFAYAIRLQGVELLDAKTKFESWRDVYKGESPSPYKINNHFGDLIHCFLCTSVWVSFIFIILYYFLSTNVIFLTIIYTLAISQITIYMYKKLN